MGNWEEFNEFTKEFLHLYEDRDFLAEAAPILSIWNREL